MEKRIFSDFDICFFVFFYQGFMFFDLPENAIVYIICSRCPKTTCSTKTLGRIWATKIKNDIPSLASMALYKMI